MARVPFIGRLFWREYLALLGSFILIFLEGSIRIITLGLPQPVIQFCYDQSKGLFNLLSSPQGRRSRSQKINIVTSIAQCADFVDLCALYGYYAEEHIVQTKDGYLLGLHRLGWRRGEESLRVNVGEGSKSKKVVYLHHGLMMNSEIWVCLTERERCLPFMLVEKGYDVWLGNNRGNKYSKKSTRYSPNSRAFWNFSMDQFAFHDIPDSIDYILQTTSQPALSYVGFSQGTAQAFATLSIHPLLNDRIDVFIALAPAMSPAGLSNGIVDALIKASPEVIFLAFGRRSILSSAMLWQALLYPPIFTRVIDVSLSFLFGWTTKNITVHQKLAAYPHLYSFTSTKSVVHWFQIIRNQCFQMYDDDVQAPFSIGASDRYYKVARFPTRNIKTPIVLVFGGSDGLVDIKVMLKELPRHTVAREIPHFEHLDFLWAQDVDTLVFPHIFDALKEYAGRDHGKDQHVTYPIERDGPFSPIQVSEYSGDGIFSLSMNDRATGLKAIGQDASQENNLSPSTPLLKSHSIDPVYTSLGDHPLSTQSSATNSPTHDAADPASPTLLLERNIINKRRGSSSCSRSLDSVGKLKRAGDGGIDIGAGKATVSVTSPQFRKVNESREPRKRTR